MIEASHDISFVIPALNEEKNIADVLMSIKQFVPANLTYQVIVIDNGSTDQTPTISTNMGASCFIKKDVSIGELRNIGVEKSNGKILVFIDADVVLTESWKKNITNSLNEINKDKNIITGSKCSVDKTCGWVANTWFQQSSTIGNVTHLGTGHLIVAKQMFVQAGGFSNTLQTGEDYDFCMRAKKLGAKIINNPLLKVVHYGVPRNLYEFVKREAWHGLGDIQYISTFIKSKVNMAALLFIVMHIMIFLSIVIESIPTYLSLISFFTIVALCVSSGYQKSKILSLYYLLKVSWLFYFYYIGRSFSLLSFFIPAIKKSFIRTNRG